MEIQHVVHYGDSLFITATNHNYATHVLGAMFLLFYPTSAHVLDQCSSTFNFCVHISDGYISNKMLTE